MKHILQIVTSCTLIILIFISAVTLFILLMSSGSFIKSLANMNKPQDNAYMVITWCRKGIISRGESKRTMHHYWLSSWLLLHTPTRGHGTPLTVYLQSGDKKSSRSYLRIASLCSVSTHALNCPGISSILFFYILFCVWKILLLLWKRFIAFGQKKKKKKGSLCERFSFRKCHECLLCAAVCNTVLVWWSRE